MQNELAFPLQYLKDSQAEPTIAPCEVNVLWRATDCCPSQPMRPYKLAQFNRNVLVNIGFSVQRAFFGFMKTVTTQQPWHSRSKRS
jgi:hypothetical protein